MTQREHAPGYIPNDAYSQEDWDAVSDNPPLSDDELSRLRPGTEGMPPEMAAAFRNRGGRPRVGARRVPISLRVDPDVLAAYKAGGAGWQTRMHDVLVAGAATVFAAETDAAEETGPALHRSAADTRRISPSLDKMAAKRRKPGGRAKNSV